MGISIEEIKDNVELKNLFSRITGRYDIYELETWVDMYGDDVNYYPDWSKKQYLEESYLENWVFDDDEVKEFKKNLKKPAWVDEFFEDCEFNLYHHSSYGVIEIP